MIKAKIKIKRILDNNIISNILESSNDMQINFKKTEFFLGYSDIKEIEKRTKSRCDSISTYGEGGITLILNKINN